MILPVNVMYKITMRFLYLLKSHLWKISLVIFNKKISLVDYVLSASRSYRTGVRSCWTHSHDHITFHVFSIWLLNIYKNKHLITLDTCSILQYSDIVLPQLTMVHRQTSAIGWHRRAAATGSRADVGRTSFTLRLGNGWAHDVGPTSGQMLAPQQLGSRRRADVGPITACHRLG